ncbi:lysophospholipid acyltransferase family protein [Tundrisphaera lichenicola]|uniref:lysophospholipid acyltransferase family protein n=1 Tax=Tundrisphaera lichenicola TaxID=2029860 RepID=UPI003EBA3B22
MDRLPLIDQFPYRFYPPRSSPFWHAVARPYNSIALLRREQNVRAIELQGLEHLEPLLDRGDGVLITPNHPDNADPAVMFEVSHRVGRRFHYLAAYQLFRGMARHVLPRIGAFPIDREGADLRAFKAGVGILTQARTPLVIFPEGEIYHVSDRLTPLREGAVAFATTAAKRLAESGKTVWVVPTAVKYRFLDDHDPMPALVAAMDRLESRFTWLPEPHRPLVERIYGYAEGLLALKELELLGEAKAGPLKERIAGLRDAILDRIEDRRVGKRRVDCVPVRVKELRKSCLEALASPSLDPAEALAIHRDLNDLFVALQLFSYPGDYVRQEPTLERIAETLLKFEQDTLGAEVARPRGPRRAIVRFGEPIDVARRLAELGKPRVAVGAITEELQSRMQRLLDAIGPGRAIGGILPSPSERIARSVAASNGS